MTATPEEVRPEEAAWTGFVLLIVPVKGLDLAEDELVQRVRDRVGTDVVLADTVRVAGGPVIGTAGLQDARAVANALVRAALDGQRRTFAPNIVFGCVLVGPELAQAEELARELAQTRSLTQLPLYWYGVGGTTLAETAAEVNGKAFELLESFERWPDFVIGAQRFLGLLRNPVPDGAARPGGNAGPGGPARPAGSAVAEPGAAPRVRWRDLLAWRRRSTPTPAEALDQLARATDAVSLAYFVLLADTERQERGVRERRTQLVVDLDRALARRRTDRAGEHPVPVETGIFTAGRSLVRHGPLRRAGQLGQVRLPKVGSDYPDLVRCVDEFEHAFRRDLTSLTSRGVDVRAATVVFLSTFAPLGDSESVDRLRAMSDRCQVVWVLLDVDPDLMSAEFAEAGALVLDDHPDIVHELMEQISDSIG